MIMKVSRAQSWGRLIFSSRWITRTLSSNTPSVLFCLLFAFVKHIEVYNRGPWECNQNIIMLLWFHNFICFFLNAQHPQLLWYVNQFQTWAIYCNSVVCLSFSSDLIIVCLCNLTLVFCCFTSPRVLHQCIRISL